MFAAPTLIDRSRTNYSAGVSGNGNKIKSKMAAKYRDNRTSITTVREQYLSYATFPTPLIFHYPLPLKVPKRENFSLAFFAQSEPTWVCDLGSGEKNLIFYQMTPCFDGFWFFAAY